MAKVNEDYLKELRLGASSHWSAAVAFSRRARAFADVAGRIQVFDPDEGVAFDVELLVDDCDWTCSCDAALDPCFHVITAALAARHGKLEQSTKQSAVSTATSASASLDAKNATITYRFWRQPNGLKFERRIRLRSHEEIMRVPLATFVATAPGGVRLYPKSWDYEVEQALGSDRSGVLKSATLQQLLSCLGSVQAEVLLDDFPVAVHSEALGLQIEIVDEGPHIRLSGSYDTRISEMFANGAVLAGGALHPVRSSNLSRDDAELVRKGAIYSSRDWTILVSEILPRLAQSVRIVNRSKRLTFAAELPVTIDWDIKVLGADSLAVIPRLAYGQPPVAKVVNDQIIMLDSNHDVPMRSRNEELVVKDLLWQRLRMEVGVEQAIAISEWHQIVGKWIRNDDKQLRVGALSQALRAGGELKVEWHDTNEGMLHQIQFKGAAGSKNYSWTLPQVINELQRGIRYWIADDGTLFTLPQEWFSKVEGIVEQLRDDSDLTPQTKQVLVDVLASSVGHTIDHFELGSRDVSSDSKRVTSRLHQVKLRPYQEQGIVWLEERRRSLPGVLLCDDMGLGKTLQSMALFEDRVLIVVPASLLGNWQAELGRFRPDLRVAVYHGGGRTLDLNADVFVTTYGVLRTDIAILAQSEWKIAVFDEAQYLRNPESQVWMAARQLRSRFFVGLTGTPIENDVMDLWSLMSCVFPGLLGSRDFFRDHYRKYIVAGDATKQEALRQRMRPVLLRRLKSEVAKDLPERTEQIVWIELNERERAVYNEIKQDLLKKLQTARSDRSQLFTMLPLLLRLRQACTDMRLVPEITESTSSKIEVLNEALEELVRQGHKSLVFSQWTSMLDLMVEHLPKDIKFLRIDGKTTDRQSVVDTFQKDDSVNVLLMSLKAGGVGLNLTAADHVFLFDPWWNPAVEAQAVDRAHRLGQTKPVFVKRYLARGTIEERMRQMQDEKRQLSEALFLGDTSGLQGLTFEDVEFLLS